MGCAKFLEHMRLEVRPASILTDESYVDKALTGWTRTHAFFLQMGGFRVSAPDGSSYPLWFERFDEIVKEGRIDFPTITEEDIKDKSKGDILAKGVAVFQTTWFIVQSIARGAQGLELAELEIVTVGFAALNAILYYLWWNKPLDVSQAYLIQLKEIKSLDGEKDQ